jgi:sugar phosphate isomerase/epimerase
VTDRTEPTPSPGTTPPPLAGGATRPLLFGTTSYVLPDFILPNVYLLAPLVDDIELILFEGEYCNLPSPAEVAEIGRLAEEGGCGFTVHLPLDVGLGEEEDGARRAAQDICLRVIERMAPLEPHAYVVHPELPLRYHPPLGERPKPAHLSSETMARWRQSLGESLARLDGAVGESPLAVENLMFPYEWAAPVVVELDLGVVMDVGHLLMEGGVVAEHLTDYGDRLTVVHLHGLIDGHDHQHIGAYPREELVAILDGIARSGDRHPVRRPVGAGDGGEHTPVVIDLEVFGWEPTVPSLRTLAALYGEEGEGARFHAAAEAIMASLPPGELLTSS